MAVEIRVPSLGESIVDAVIATWLKSEGDEVKQKLVLSRVECCKRFYSRQEMWLP